MNQTVTAYIQDAPKAAQKHLRALRAIIKKVVPEAEEKISYSMPFYSYYGRLAYIAAFKDHVSLFAMPPIAKKYAAKLNVTGKATIRFELDEKLPLGIIAELLKAGVKRNEVRNKIRKCSRGHNFKGSGPCPTCWPGRLKKKK